MTGIIQPAHGSAALSGGNIVYTPVANYHGADSVGYTIGDGHGATAEARLSLTVTPVNDGPVAAPDAVTTAEDTAAAITVLTNDSDADGDTLLVTVGFAPAHGTAINSNGTITYTPAANYHGVDEFRYTVSDGNGGSATAVVNLTVTGVNDAPVAGHDTATATEDEALRIAVMENDGDLDGDTLALTSVTAPAHGSAVVNENGTITYTPVANYNGADSFGYTIADGNGGTAAQTVAVTVTAVNDAPIAVNDATGTFEDTIALVPVLLNDRELDGDTLTLTAVGVAQHGTTAIQPDRRIAYMPGPNFNGADSFTYTLTDGQGGASTATVSVIVRPVNDRPAAFDDAVTTAEDTVATIAALANDFDADGDTLRVTTVRAPLHGTTALNSDGTLSYRPAGNYSGADRFTYTIADGDGSSATATVNVTVTPVNDVPVPADDTVTMAQGTSAAIVVLANDVDADGDRLTVTVLGTPEHGTVVVNPNGVVSYTPDAAHSGTDFFSYTISDGHGGSATGTVHVTVNAAN